MDEIFNGALSSVGSAIATGGIKNIVSAVVILIVCFIGIKIIMNILNPVFNHSNLDRTVIKFLKSAIRVVLYILAVIITLGALGFETSSLVALFSVAGLAASLAMQNSLANLAGGLMLLISKPMACGDYVQAGSQEGTVEEVGLVYTKIVTVDNKIVSIPNSSISSSDIVNFTRLGKRRVDVTVNASYDSSIASVKNALKEAVLCQELALKDEEIFTAVTGYKESTIEYQVRAWCKAEDYWTVYFGIIESIQSAFEKNGVNMSFSHLNVHVINN